MAHARSPFLVFTKSGGYLGPVEVREHTIVDSEGNDVATLESYRDDDSGLNTHDQVADTARLFCAAPDLLKAANALLQSYTDRGARFDYRWKTALFELRLAVEQAEGVQAAQRA